MPQESAVEPERRGVLLEIRRFQGPGDVVLLLEPDGRLARWDLVGGRLQRQGSARLSPAKTRELLDLGERIEAGTEMGEGLTHGDIYRMVDRRRGVVSVALGQLASEALLSFSERLVAAGAEVTTHEPAQTSLRAEPLDADQVEQLRSRGVHAHSHEHFSPEEWRVLTRACERPYEPCAAPSTVVEGFLERSGHGANPFVRIDDEQWFQVELMPAL